MFRLRFNIQREGFPEYRDKTQFTSYQALLYNKIMKNVKNILNEPNVSIKSKVTIEPQELLQRYVEGQAMASLGATFGVSRQTILRILQKRDANYSKSRQAYQEQYILDLRAKSKELILQGFSKSEIIQKLKIRKSYKVFSGSWLIEHRKQVPLLRIKEALQQNPTNLRQLSKILGMNERTLAEWMGRNCPELLRQISQRSTTEELRDREKKVRQLLQQSPIPTRSQIAQNLGISYVTFIGWIKNNHPELLSLIPQEKRGCSAVIVTNF